VVHIMSYYDILSRVVGKGGDLTHETGTPRAPPADARPVPLELAKERSDGR
jgi:hypothetical protein